jgi:hypothetical protein
MSETIAYPTTVRKPAKLPRGEYSYTASMAYIQSKYHIATSSLVVPEKDFWHWLWANTQEQRKGSRLPLDVKAHLEGEETLPDFVRTMLERIQIEFGDNVEFYVSW